MTSFLSYIFNVMFLKPQVEDNHKCHECKKYNPSRDYNDHKESCHYVQNCFGECKKHLNLCIKSQYHKDIIDATKSCITCHGYVCSPCSYQLNGYFYCTDCKPVGSFVEYLGSIRKQCHVERCIEKFPCRFHDIDPSNKNYFDNYTDYDTDCNECKTLYTSNNRL